MPPRIKIPTNVKAKLEGECNKLVLRIKKAAGEESEADAVARKAAQVRRDWPPP